MAPDGSAPNRSRYNNVLIKKDGKWLLASVRESAYTDPSNHQFLGEHQRAAEADSMVVEAFTAELAVSTVEAFTAAELAVFMAELESSMAAASFMEERPATMVVAHIIMVETRTTMVVAHITMAVAPITTAVTGRTTTAVTTAPVLRPEPQLRRLRLRPRSLATTLTTPASAITLLSLQPLATKSSSTNK
jgi:hypothetical protein